MSKKLCRNLLCAGAVALAVFPLISFAGPNTSTNAGYSELDLVSDGFTNATHTDPRLLNPWGLVTSPGTIWVANNHSGLVTSYSGAGNPTKSVVATFAPDDGDPGEITGLTENHTDAFVVTNRTKRTPAAFIACAEDGVIYAWNPSITGTNAIVVTNLGAFDANYKGLDIARDTNNAPHLYAANFHSGVVDVFNGQFHLTGHFTDPDVPSDYAPFNVKTIRGRLFVTFAKRNSSEDDEPGPGNGYVDIFDTDGTLLRRFASRGALNSPWGMAIAPKKFGKFSGALLVGNFGDGKINAYDLLTGKWLGNLTTSDGSDLQIPGLWALGFEKEETPGRESDYSAQRLYFTAGSNGEQDGLVGILRPVSPNFPPAR